MLERGSEEFDGEFHLDSQSSFVPQVFSSFVDMILQGTNIKKTKITGTSKSNNIAVY